MVTVMTELCMLGGAMILRPKGVFDASVLGYTVRCGVACSAMVSVVLATGVTGLLAKVVLGAAVYGAISLLLGTCSVNEGRNIVNQILSRPRLRRASA